jgi:protein-tyrosine kinase
LSRVHEALRRAGQVESFAQFATEPRGIAPLAADLLALVERAHYAPSLDGLMLDAARPHEPPGEEVRTIRTRLNHIQSLQVLSSQPMHTVLVTSPSPAEGKSFLAANLALAEAQLAGNLTLLCDFDFRRPAIHNLFGIDRAPGISDYFQGKVPLHYAMRRIGDGNLYVMPAGEPVINPLELLNLKEVRPMLDRLAGLFNWIVLDSPPLLVAADASLLSTLCHGTILVARIGATTVDSIARGMQSLCQNNVLGIVVNGARRGELYGKYGYYRTYSSNHSAIPAEALEAARDGACDTPKAPVI